MPGHFSRKWIKTSGHRSMSARVLTPGFGVQGKGVITPGQEHTVRSSSRGWFLCFWFIPVRQRYVLDRGAAGSGLGKECHELEYVRRNVGAHREAQVSGFFAGDGIVVGPLPGGKGTG
jgi:hypothetical protein